MHSLGLEFTVRVPDVDESLIEGESPVCYVHRLASAKALAVAETIVDDPDPAPTVVVAADTVVVVNGTVLGKPTDEADAASMLRTLSGSEHQVLTGVSVLAANKAASTVVTTEVEFVDIDEATIAWYIATGEPADKAGAYAVQGSGGSLVLSIGGSVSNVVGLPLAETADLLSEVGHPLASLRSQHQ